MKEPESPKQSKLSYQLCCSIHKKSVCHQAFSTTVTDAGLPWHKSNRFLLFSTVSVKKVLQNNQAYCVLYLLHKNQQNTVKLDICVQLESDLYPV